MTHAFGIVYRMQSSLMLVDGRPEFNLILFTAKQIFISSHPQVARYIFEF